MRLFLGLFSLFFLLSQGLFADEKQDFVYVIKPKLSGFAPDVAETVLSTAAAQLQKEGLKTLTEQEAKEIIENQSKTMMLSGDSDEASISKLGQLIGARYLLAITLSKLDNDNLVQARLIESRDIKVLSRRQSRSSDFDGSLIKAIENAVKLSVAPIFAYLKGRLEVKVNEEGASILVDDKIIGVSPFKAFDVTGGFHKLSVNKEGFIEFRETFKIEKERLLTKEVSLVPSADYLKTYLNKNRLYRRIAWWTTALALPALGFGAFSSVKWQDKNDEMNQLTEKYRGKYAESDPKYRASQKEINDASDAANTWKYYATASISGGLLLGAASGYFWIFGEDPDRYEEFEERYNLD